MKSLEHFKKFEIAQQDQRITKAGYWTPSQALLCAINDALFQVYFNEGNDAKLHENMAYYRQFCAPV